MQRLFCHHQHPVLCVSPHVLVHVQRSHRHVDPTGQELHLQIQQKTLRHVPTLNPNANTQMGNVAITCPAPSSLQRSIAKARSIAANTASASSVWECRISCRKLSYITGSKKAKSCQFTCSKREHKPQ